MGISIKPKQKIKYRIRKKISGTPERPRLSIFRSNKNIYAQLIDDVNGVTLASASSTKLGLGSNAESAKAVGKLIAEQAVSKNINSAVFDRGGNLYHGRIKALADAAREGGIKF